MSRISTALSAYTFPNLFIEPTPVTREGLRKNDDKDPVIAAVRAWSEPGSHPAEHEKAKFQVRQAMPLLARALDRLQEGDK